MRSLNWILRGMLFLLLLAFAIKNSATVPVLFFFGVRWDVPLSLVMLLFFVAGAALGVTAALVSSLRTRRELGRLRRVAGQPDSAS